MGGMSLAEAIASGKLTAISRRRESMCGSRQQAALIAAALKKEKKEKKKSKKKDREKKQKDKEKDKEKGVNSSNKTIKNNIQQKQQQQQPLLATAAATTTTSTINSKVVLGKSASPPSVAITAAPIPVLITQPQLTTAAMPTQVGAKQLPFYNTIYGKLQEQPTTTVPPTVAATLAPTPISKPQSSSNIPSLAEFLEATKSKAAAAVSSVAAAATAAPAVATPTAVVPVPAAAATVAAPSSNSAMESMPPPSSTPLKLYTRTASHDPRLNPMLTVPEPAPMPKRKLSISEYRMRHRPSVDTAPTTPTTPTTPTMERCFVRPQTINKCSLQSPERYQAAMRERRNSISVHQQQQQQNNNSSSSSSTNHFQQQQQQQQHHHHLSSPSSLKKPVNSAAGTLSIVNNILSTAHKLNMFDDKSKGKCKLETQL